MRFGGLGRPVGLGVSFSSWGICSTRACRGLGPPPQAWLPSEAWLTSRLAGGGGRRDCLRAGSEPQVRMRDTPPRAASGDQSAPASLFGRPCTRSRARSRRPRAPTPHAPGPAGPPPCCRVRVHHHSAAGMRFGGSGWQVGFGVCGPGSKIPVGGA